MIISQSSLSSKDLFVRVDSSRIWAIWQYVNTKTWQVLRTRFPDVLNLAKYKKQAPTMQPAGLEKD